MNSALWVVQVLLLALYASAGIMKVFATSKARTSMSWAGRHPEGYVRLVGGSELLGALGLVLPLLTGILPILTPLAAIGLSLVQILAILTEHLPHKEYSFIPLNVLLFALSVFVAVGRFGLLAG
jgi:uncharacterized membrane protein YphA (DoxX/SURF4 family)